MSGFYQIIEAVNGPPRYGEDRSDLMIESRAYNRRQFILARRSLPLEKRPRLDALFRAVMERSIAAWIGQPSVHIRDLADLVQEGWTREGL